MKQIQELTDFSDEEDDQVKGAIWYTREQKKWLLDPTTIAHFKDDELTQKERIEEFFRTFPEAPDMSLTTLRNFYRKNGISADELYSE